MANKLLPTVAEVEAFYMRASKITYASGNAPVSVPFLPKAKMFTVIEGDFHYIDIWISGEKNPDGLRNSHSTTYIYFDGQVIWTMWYHGWWQNNVPGVIEFLKRAMVAATEFLGGRGPETFEEDSWIYHNNLKVGGFINFRGHDTIKLVSDQEVYRHNYQGSTLVDLPI